MRFRHLTLLASCALFATLLHVSCGETARASTLIGRVAGSFGTTATGAATYTIPIEVAAGVNGLRPSVALAYSSQSGQGPAGEGWGLAGFSEIARCPLTLAVDGRIQGVRFGNQDRFCLDGRPLILLTGTYGADGATYRREVHEYETVISKGRQGSGPLYFEVRHPDGSVHRYGNDDDSRIEASATGEVRAWALNEIEDRFRQRISFDYADDTAHGEYHPTRILWAWPAAEGPAQARYRLTFTWEDRPLHDQRSGFVWGSAWREALRLVAVDYEYNSGAGFSRLHRYSLAYHEPAEDGPRRSQLASITACGQRDCLQPTTFEWDDGAAPRERITPIAIAVTHTVFGDFNGDGAADAFGSDQGHWAVWPANPDDGGFLAPLAIGGSVTDSSVGKVIDYNGDGLADLMTGSSQGPNWIVWLAPEQPGAAFTPRNTGVPWSNSTEIEVLDYDGDGFDDIAYLRNAQVYLRHNNGGWLGAEASAGVAPVPAPNQPYTGSFGFLSRADFDGDGRADLLVTRSTAPANTANYRWEALLSRGGGFGPDPIAALLTAAVPGKVLIADVNGDGLTDVLIYADGGWRVHISQGTGSAATPGLVMSECPAAVVQSMIDDPAAFDYDGDGRDDLVVASGTTSRVYLSDGQCFDPAGKLIESPGLQISRVAPVDADGDGSVDILFGDSARGRWTLLRSLPRPRADGLEPARHAGLLRRITDGLGNTVDVDYQPLVSARAYTWSGEPLAGTRAVRGGPFTVVTRYRTATPGEPAYAVTLDYADARLDSRGRGFLGFETTRTLDSRSGLEAETTWRQDFPFIGRARRSVTRDGANPVTTTDASWLQFNAPAADPAGGTNFVHLAAESTVTYEVDADGGYRGSAAQRIERRLDWNYTHGAVGTEVTETSSPLAPGVSFRVTRSVAFDDGLAGTGCLALPARVDVTYEATGQAAVTRNVRSAYDPSTCRVVSTTAGPAGVPGQQVDTTYAYDTTGRVVTITRRDAAGVLPPRQTRLTYAQGGARPLTEARVIDGEPDLVLAHAWHDGLGLETGRSEPQGVMTGWQYDEFGRVTVEVRSGGRSVFRYSGCGPCFAPTARYARRETRSDGWWSETQHDGAGRVVGRAFVLADGRTSHQVVEYDALGRVRRESAPYVDEAAPRYWTSIGYDQLGRIKVMDKPAAAAIPSGVVTSWTYAGLQTTVRDALGQATVYERDALGQLTGSTAPLGASFSYGYDAAGRLTSISDPGGSVRRYDYDSRGLLIRADDPDGGKRNFTYDAFGDLVGQADGMSPPNVVALQYDQLGRVVTRTEPEGTTRWSYVGTNGGGRGLLRQVSGPTGDDPSGFVETYTYDSRGKLVKTSTRIDGDVYDTDYNYGPESKLRAMTYPATVGWRPRFLFGYANGHLVVIAQDNAFLTPVYSLAAMDARGRDAAATFGYAALDEHNDYDAATGRLTGIRTGPPGSPGAIQDYGYEWDRSGRLESRRDRRAGVEERFAYDALNRLTAVTLNGTPTLAITYQPDGNIRSKSDVGNYAYGLDGQRPHAVSAVAGGPLGLMSYGYDANGNMTSRNGLELAWTSFNQPRLVRDARGESRFSYGPDRTRVSATFRDGGSVKTVRYVGPHFEIEEAGGIRRFRATVFAYGRAVYSQVESTAGGPEAYYVLHDHLGSVDRLARAAGSGADLLPMSFDAWGKRRNVDWTADPGGKRFGDAHWVERGFTGHEHLDAARLVSMNGRLQDPVLGRMLSPDPLLAGLINGQALNPYSYVLNDPASNFDPSGYLFSKLRKAIKRGLRHVGAFGRRFVHRWGRAVVASVAAWYSAGAVSSWAYAAQAPGIASAAELASVTASSAVLGGAAGGAVAGAISTGTLRGTASGAFSGGLMGGIGAQYGATYNAGRVLTEAYVGGVAAELSGGDFRDGFVASGLLSSTTWAALAMRRAMVEQSRLNPANASGPSAGFMGDGFKLGGCRFPCRSSPLGGVQGSPGRFFGVDYVPGSFLDQLIETYAGPHDFLNAPFFYDELGNNIGRPALLGVVNAGNVLVATPFAAASAIPPFAYGAFAD